MLNPVPCFVNEPSYCTILTDQLHILSRVTAFCMLQQSHRRLSSVQVAEAARLKQETAIGYIRESGSLQLAPAATERHTYSSGDFVIIIGCRVVRKHSS